MTWTLSAFADEAAESCDDQLVALQQAHIHRVDIRMIDGFNIVELPLDHAVIIAKKLDDANITVGMFGSPIGKTDITDDLQQDLVRLEHLGKLSSILGCNTVRIFSDFNEQSLASTQREQQSIDRLLRLRDAAGHLGLILYHENEKDIYGDRCERVLKLADKVRDNQAFRLIFDFDNYHIFGEDTWDNWLALQDVTDGFHLKDSDENQQHVPAGQGAGQLRKILTDAQDRGWVGHLALEPHLSYSAAVMATGPSGQVNEALCNVTPDKSFQLAAEAANAMLNEIGVPSV